MLYGQLFAVTTPNVAQAYYWVLSASLEQQLALSLNPVTVDRSGRGQPTRPAAAVKFDQYGGQFRVTAARVSLQTSCNSVVSERNVGSHAS